MTAPRTILTLTAALDAVMVRVDAAGLRPEQIAAVTLYPLNHNSGGTAVVAVYVQLRRNDGFDELVSVLGEHDRDDSADWFNAVTVLPDETELTVTAPVGGAV